MLGAAKRLCPLSRTKGIKAPGLLVLEHHIQMVKSLRLQAVGYFFALARLHQALVKGTDGRIRTAGRDRGHV